MSIVCEYNLELVHANTFMGRPVVMALVESCALLSFQASFSAHYTHRCPDPTGVCAISQAVVLFVFDNRPASVTPAPMVSCRY